jgi:hypothetical protein
MQVKVQIKYELWPYEETMAVTIPAEDFDKLDLYVDSITSNLKMRIMTQVKNHHPNTWYKQSPLNIEQLKELTKDNAATTN